MALSINTFIASANDTYRPPISKPSLQQYDNYQIYDIYCFDVVSNTKVINSISGETNTVSNQLKQGFIAVQAYSPDAPILCDFSTIAEQYH